MAAHSCAQVVTLTSRPQFLSVARGRRQGCRSMVLQARCRDDGDTHIGVGFTCSKKVGNAVARNRAKRRLREVARAVLPLAGQAGWDYVLIGKHDITAARPFADLKGDLAYCLKKIHKAE
ncbi:MAG: ribonuclease P protein component [Rhodobacteraceae bacterium]|nr:ribonuclease P protein component [Paracoccaceae bacterium]